MRLSEAIRLGAMLSPQARGGFSVARRKYFFGLIGPKVEATCALGAAYQAYGGGCHTETADGTSLPFRGAPRKAGEPVSVWDTPSHWPFETWVRCPECIGTAMQIKRLIPHLNDDHEWTRERIAELVAKYEWSDGPTNEDGTVMRWRQGDDVRVEEPNPVTVEFV